MKDSTRKLLKLIRSYEKIRNNYVETYTLVSQLRDDIKSGQFTLEEMASILQVMRKSSKFLDDLRKELDGVAVIFEQVCCIRYTQKYINAPNAVEPIRTTLTTATPQVSMRAKIPKLRDDPKQYFALMKYLGISEENAKTEIFRVHWPSLNARLSALAEEGKPLPPGLSPDDTYPAYAVKVRPRRNIDEIVSELNDTKGGDDAYEEILTRRP